MEKTLYSATATAIAGRGGHAESDDKRISVDLNPPAMPNRPATGTDPEQLFACGYAACFGGAVEAVAKRAEVTMTAPVKVVATVDLMTRAAGGFQLGVALDVTVTGVDDATARKLVEDAHQVCPYSNATRNNVDVKLTAHGVQA